MIIKTAPDLGPVDGLVGGVEEVAVGVRRLVVDGRRHRARLILYVLYYIILYYIIYFITILYYRRLVVDGRRHRARRYYITLNHIQYHINIMPY